MLKKFFKTVAVILCLIMVIGSFVVSATDTDAIAISSKADLKKIKSNLSADYYLTQDIVITAADYEKGGTFYSSDESSYFSIGSYSNPFKGSFNGNGYSISGLKIIANSSGWTGDYIIGGGTAAPKITGIGLFAANTGTIANLTLYDCEIMVNSAANYVGAIVGYNTGAISNCAVYGTVTAKAVSNIGMISGYNNGGAISNCVSRGYLGTVGTCGGIVGGVAGGTVSNCYTSVFDGGAAIGAIADGTTPIVLSCYYISSVEQNGVGDIITPENVKTATYYENFDFDGVWTLDNIYQTPYLKSAKTPRNSVAVSGDADLNGKVNLADVVAIAQYISGWEVEVDLDAANVNRDYNTSGFNNISLADVIYLSQNIAGWDTVKLF